MGIKAMLFTKSLVVEVELVKFPKSYNKEYSDEFV